MSAKRFEAWFSETYGGPSECMEPTLIAFAIKVWTAAEVATIDKAAVVVKDSLHHLTREMEGYSYFGNNPGIPEDDYDEVIDNLKAMYEPRTT